MAAPALPLASYKPPCSRPARLLAQLTRWPRIIELLWRSARVVGRTRRWLSSGWRRVVLWIALVGSLLYAFDRWAKPLSWLGFWSGLAVAIIGAFAVAVWRARGRVVIEPFVDYNKAAASTKNGGGQPTAPGLNDALVSELAALRELYRAVGERAEVDPAVGSGASKPVDATLELQDVSEFLQNASTGDATVSVGPLALPIGTVLAMLGRLAQGPRVTGGLQLVATPDGDGETPGGEIVLTAYYSGPTRLASWRVREPLPDYAASLLKTDEGASVVQTAVVRAMVQELAARIFADLALEGTRSWRATRRFLEGLKQYRLAHESQQDRVLKLRRAERAFIEALADDTDLPLARYNLGVVYRELNDEAPNEDFAKAAENAFQRELQREQPSWQPYYALAVICYVQARHADVSSLCDRVIELTHGSARKAIAYDLKGLADRLRDESPLGLAKAIESRRRAVSYALLALLGVELTADDPASARGLLARCLLDLGVGLAYDAQGQDATSTRGAARRRSSYQQCRSLLCSAARLEDSFAPHLELGKIAFEFAEPAVAVREFRAAARIDPTSSLCWALLAKTNASLSAGSTDPASAAEWARRAQDAIRLARLNLNVDGSDAAETTSELAEAFDDLGDGAEAERTRSLRGVRSSLEDENDVTDLTQRFESEGDAWTRGQLAWRLGDVHREAGEHEVSEHFFREAIDALEDYPEEIRRSGLRGLVAMALASREVPQQALREARAAISVNPMSSWEREVLGYIHHTIGDLDSAIAAYEDALSWHDALSWRRGNPSTLHTSLGDCHLGLAGDSPNPARRAEMYRRGIRHLQDALDLQSHTDLAKRVEGHYRLGSAYTQGDEYERAVPHFKNALAAGESRPVVQVLLGQAYVRMKRYDDAENVLAEAIKAAATTANVDPRLTISEPTGEEWLAAELAAAAYRTRALSFIERDARRSEARRHIEESDRLLQLLGDQADDAALASGRELEARILLEEGHPDEAIAALNESVGLAADAEAYFHLAQAYRTKAAASRQGKQRDRALQLASRACGHAGDLDTTSMFDERIGLLLAELDGMSLAAPA